MIMMTLNKKNEVSPDIYSPFPWIPFIISYQLKNKVEGEKVMADGRTIFLSFSRGYPVSNAELHDYFTRY